MSEIPLTAHHARMLAANPRPSQLGERRAAIVRKVLADLDDSIHEVATFGGKWVHTYNRPFYGQDVLDSAVGVLQERGFTVSQIAVGPSDIDPDTRAVSMRISWEG